MRLEVRGIGCAGEAHRTTVAVDRRDGATNQPLWVPVDAEHVDEHEGDQGDLDTLRDPAEGEVGADDQVAADRRGRIADEGHAREPVEACDQRVRRGCRQDDQHDQAGIAEPVEEEQESSEREVDEGGRGSEGDDADRQRRPSGASPENGLGGHEHLHVKGWQKERRRSSLA